MNLGLLHLPWGHKHGFHAGKRPLGMSYSETVAPLDVQRRLGFVMVSTLDHDARRMRLHHGALPSKDAFLAALQSEDLHFKQVSTETGLYFADREANAAQHAHAQAELDKLDYLLLFTVTYEQLAGTSNIYQDTLRPRLYNRKGQLVKRMEECYWSDDAVACELQTFVGALARAIRMELRGIIRRMESLH
jgi:hypothetical protein